MTRTRKLTRSGAMTSTLSEGMRRRLTRASSFIELACGIMCMYVIDSPCSSVTLSTILCRTIPLYSYRTHTFYIPRQSFVMHPIPHVHRGSATLRAADIRGASRTLQCATMHGGTPQDLAVPRDASLRFPFLAMPCMASHVLCTFADVPVRWS